ncbi:hypothetical protein AUEXF2481DRAFT_9016 [Aureobasidium subglaciale EXF-2481]|uniref:Serine/threonine-protein kinase Tel1 n=1 Tax=Aureobasidium subglaciale (strain EXF-2481) TaxID=1043005 RepID=A0A074Y4J7_AURSE|nr:uncharacterized protein AUEXF2481DRAFT_9016 [Aureobasidium subglaciale EXF-2481]KAI5205260.1 hypothetical protein E4T38_04400 [Aureobasidium subglaciale]KAI5224151.1 hypothetical protein E4T40_04176 [Aureobasidium subglaciale]KAI5228347.1 hypothetical protein E4T41_03937 [Aureobasidium subglaciale]KAI5262932.1 hypothetical protein E4T46_04144 [Aureobasidium subglaciale]KEQ90894.1 hypothetical protein AUEXF2481DRAFT_9016 [Aureobasidium subglaciale EXF-2481]
MASDMNLAEALDGVSSPGVRERKEAMMSLRQILRHNQGTSRIDNLKDSALFKIYDTLFHAIALELTMLKACKGGSKKSTVSAIEGRLSDCSATLRVAVDAGVRNVRSKSIKALIDHILNNFAGPDGLPDTILSSDYAKNLSVLLGHEPHVEHLSYDLWHNILDFCLDSVQTVCNPGSGLGSSILSSRSSRSHFAPSQASANNGVLSRQAVDDLVNVVRSLTSVSFAPFLQKGTRILTAMSQYLQNSQHMSKPQIDALVVINTVLLQMRTEDVKFTKRFARDALTLTKMLWNTKLSAMKDEVLSMLVLLHPFVDVLSHDDTDELFPIDISNLVETLKTEYTRRSLKDQLQLNSLSLQLALNRPSDGLRGQIFSLRDGQTFGENTLSTEHNWTLLKLLAQFTIMDDPDDQRNDNRSTSPGSGPYKRQRVAHWSDELLRTLSDPNLAIKVCSLQLICFIVQSANIEEEVLGNLVEKLTPCILDDNSYVVSWAHIALASCAGQVAASSESLTGAWKSIWRYTLRAVNPAQTCRTACHLLHAIIQTDLIDRTMILESVSSMLSNISINGPSVFDDSVAGLFQTILEGVQRESTSSFGERSGQILTWLFHTWAPSNFHDKIFASQNATTDVITVMNLINACLGLPREPEPLLCLPIWGPVAQSWILHSQTQDLLDYLLLKNKAVVVHVQPDQANTFPERGFSMSSITVALLLGLCTTETNSAVEKWHNMKEQGAGYLDRHMVRMVSTLIIVGRCLANCLRGKNTHRTEQLRAANKPLTTLLFKDLSSPGCEQDKVDALIDLVAHRPLAHQPKIFMSEDRSHHACMSDLSTSLLDLVEKRREMTESDASVKRNNISDTLDFDTDFESQVTSHTAPVNETQPLRKVVPSKYSIVSQRASVTIYAMLLQSSCIGPDDMVDDLPENLIPHVLELPTSEILASGPFLTALPRYGVQLTPKQFEPLLEFFADNTLQSYELERAETNMDLLLGVMESFVYTWTDPSDQDFYTFGLDIYKWFTVTALKAKLLSPCVQKRIVRLMLQILQIDADYGQTDKLPTVRSMLFRLMREGTLDVKHFIAQHLSSIFRLFPLSAHAEILEELKASLPTDLLWIEGLAVRILISANLAADWHSLRRQCIFHIFETAGMIVEAEDYAATCIAKISDALKLKSAREVFQLFSPQLLYVWLETQAVSRIPFKIFGYKSMAELLEHNMNEIYAQLLMREKDDQIQWLTKMLDLTEAQVSQSTFSKTLAYAISWDVSGRQVSSQDPSQVTTICETRLRGFYKTSGDYYAAVKSNLPDIIAQIFTSIYHEEVAEKLFEKKSQYAYAKDALSAMKRHGSLDTDLSQAQQPCFKGRYLIDQLERVCRRTGNKTFTTVKDILDVPHITVTLRSIIDSMHPAYGPLEACRTVRKLRIFLALAGDEVFRGYPLQTMIRTLQPVIIDPHCSDDGMGMLQYLLERGKSFLKQEISMFTGTGLLILLSLKQFMISRQDKTTQESQFRNTVSRMQSFHDWLVTYLLEFRSSMRLPQQQNAFCSLVESCRDLELSAPSGVSQAANTLLKGLLDDEESVTPVLGPIERKQVTSTLCHHFHVTDKAHDMFASDELSLSYARRVWESTQKLTIANEYGAWAARVIGRAYASTVSLEQIRPTRGLISHLTSTLGETNHSTRAIVTKLNDLLSSQDRTHVGVAEQSLRKIANCFMAQEDHNGVIDFERILPVHVVDAIARIYHKDIPEIKDSQKLRREDLWRAAKLNRNMPFESWVQNLTVSICQWAKGNPLVGQLENLFASDVALSQELFPFIVHLALSSEVEKEPVLRTYLSESFSAHFNHLEPGTSRKSRLLIESLLYLLTQKLPNEKTRLKRLEWLELDYLLAAKAADGCNMPTASLYLSEIGATPEDCTPPSRRSSVNLSTSKTPSNELLLSIYSRVDDPDSFYGVKQPPSLESVLARVHHEGDGIKGLMLHSARIDASMRKSGLADESDASGLISSAGAMNLSSLTHELLNRRSSNQPSTATTDTMLDAARKLEQWDLNLPQTEGSAVGTLYSVFRGLASATYLESVQLDLDRAFNSSIQHLRDTRLDASAVRATLSGIAVLNEVDELIAVRCSSDLTNLWDRMQKRQMRWDIGQFNDAQSIVSCRETLFSLLSRNKNLREALHVNIRDCRAIEARSVISSSQFARRNDLIQQSLTAATYLSQLVPICQEVDVKMDAAAHFEVATTLWRQGEISTSVQMLQELCLRTDLLGQSIQVGRPGMLAQLGHEIADARLEQPGEVIANYLRPAIEQLDDTTSGSETGKVYHEFGSFCDQQLQDPGNLEDYQRLAKLRDRKLGELKQYDELIKRLPASDKERKKDLQRQQKVVHTWYKLDDEEFQRMKRSRDDFVRQSLQNYLRALKVSDEFNSSVVRFFALWLEHSDSEIANTVVQKNLPEVPSWKFVGLMNQQTSRLQRDSSIFQQSLASLITRVCTDHPHHGVHYLYTTCYSSVVESEQAALSRRNAAHEIATKLSNDKRMAETMRRSFKVSNAYHKLAEVKMNPKEFKGKITVNMVPQAKEMVSTVMSRKMPPATMSVKLRLDCDYSSVPIVARYRDDIRIANGLSAPKIMVAIGTDGKEYRQLFKGGNDDLRQDAIMEQVFGEVSKMLQTHKTSRQRNLHVRTYKVLPLTSTSGIIEFVPHSMPLGEFLVPAHVKYHPSDLTQNKAREKIGGAQGLTADSRLKVYREVTARHQPVLRHFFFERFQDPDDWFQKRLNYTRSTATISILGWILGLGDRHCHNILLDEKSGEAIHIDLGVAFEAGRVLPIPEVVPFRLTRDIVDGMGVTKTEGVFRRCCEFSMDALRAEKDAIMTLLNVLRYDPLYSWTVSPLKARRMQDPTRNGDDGGNGLGSASKPEDEAGEAARALAIVEKKLSKSLSTAATVNELIQQASDERNLAVLFAGWAAYC